MSTLLNKSYLVKVSTKGEGGGQKCPKFCLRGLYTAPFIEAKFRAVASYTFEALLLNWVL